MTDQLTFYLPTVPVVLPDKPPVVKKPFPKRVQECGECGRPIKGRGFQRGDLCRDCRVVVEVGAEAAARICCGNCPQGECLAIPY